MRAMWWLALAGAVLVLNVWGIDGARPASPSKGAATQRAPEPGDILVDGYGETPDKARQVALARGRQRVAELLETRLGRSGWRPTLEQLETEYLVRFGVLTPRGEPEPAPVQGERMLVARYRVELTPEYLREVVRQARQEKVQERHLLLARVLAAILAVTLVTAGYLRLEEMTCGYATQLLRAAAVVLLGLAGVGLWLTM